MTRIRHAWVAALIIAVTAVASGCGVSGGTPKAPASAPASASASETTAAPAAGAAPTGPAPAGYKWAGSAGQGVWFAVPKSWASIDLSKLSINQAISRFHPKGMSTTFLRNVLTQLSQRHAIFMMDLASTVSSPHHFATNGNAFCTPTPITPTAGSSQAIKAAMQAEYTQIQAKVLSLTTATINGHPAVKSTLRLTSTAGQAVTENQYAVLASDSHLCTVTLTTDNPSAFRKTFGVIGGSILVG